MSIILDGTAGITTTGLLTGTNATIGNVSSSEINYLDGITSAVQTQLNGKEPTIAAGNTAQYWRGDKTWQTLPTPDLSAYAPKASPTFTGDPTAPTASVGDNDTTIATTAFVNAEISADVGVANSVLVKTALNATGSAPIYACRAWVNFDGTGTVAIRASGNVSSITDNGVGDYNVNFTTAMPDANYCVVATNGQASAINDEIILNYGTQVTSATRIITGKSPGGGSSDMDLVNVAIFR